MTIFDRFIRYEWAEFALSESAQKNSSSQIKAFLIEQGLAPQSARRTANILSNMWFPKDPLYQHLREKALTMLPVLSQHEHLALHWGMGLCVFPLFRQVAKTIGLLSRIQEVITKQEVISRLLGEYSNQITIRRSIERVIQTFFNWGVLEEKCYGFIPSSPITLSNDRLIEWLFQAVILQSPDKYLPVQDLIRATEIFPFEVKTPILSVFEKPPFSVHRDASGDEIIGINYTALVPNYLPRFRAR